MGTVHLDDAKLFDPRFCDFLQNQIKEIVEERPEAELLIMGQMSYNTNKVTYCFNSTIFE